MATFEELKTLILGKGKLAADKAKETAEMVNLKAKIAANKESMKKFYVEIGKKYFEAHKADLLSDYSEEMSKLKEFEEKNAELEKKLEELKG